MAYSVITTPVTGTTISTTTFGILVKDNFDAAFPLGVDGWTSFTPTLVQSGTVTKTVNYAKYQRVGRLIVAQYVMSVTGSGTAANAVIVGLPVSTAAYVANPFTPIGSGGIFDTSAASYYKGIAIAFSSTTFVFRPTSTTTAGVLGSDTFTAGLAAGDTVEAFITFEAAS